MHAGADDTK